MEQMYVMYICNESMEHDCRRVRLKERTGKRGNCVENASHLVVIRFPSWCLIRSEGGQEALKNWWSVVCLAIYVKWKKISPWSQSYQEVKLLLRVKVSCFDVMEDEGCICLIIFCSIFHFMCHSTEKSNPFFFLLCLCAPCSCFAIVGPIYLFSSGLSRQKLISCITYRFILFINK